METSVTAAAWFLPFVVPICAYVAWSDMSRMKIPNVAVYALVATYAVAGFLTLETGDFLWRWVHLAVALVAGFLLYLIRVFGAGDAKFIAAAAPFVAYGDLTVMFPLYIVCFLVTFVLHRLARATPLRNLAPSWVSWNSGQRFPMGIALGATLVAYLVLALRPDWYQVLADWLWTFVVLPDEAAA